ncbi:UDP-N-acetylmuramoyl-L-alanyl-D-glutamate--2,6-diaminopimelate ligase [Caldalkalibacillus salinus]|uniref:UDP-N-acetylmuramoyl-L-alanyl-D-glutamate--2, 6-diaminopimelate ligase n=1 Tax=Caldalkalibacillus salinus TaxID=2803787 RepID=UPI001922A9BC|nr:UDP-N-acetylmuramoyl-L-alanyl-D-glutamate--2,6-diaminopimelate ligase [Caldalkalibacillus salinus]
MQLLTLIEPLVPYKWQNDQVLNKIEDMEITSIEMDSRKVTAGAMFVCIEGFHVDGHQYVQQAVEKGAKVIVAQKPVQTDIPVIIVPDTRRTLAVVADTFYQHPTQKLRVIGVTGTNGKTTVTHLIEQILEDAQHKTGRIGTIGAKIGNNVEEVANTTPESSELQNVFHRMSGAGCEYAVIEASSHAIHMGRLRGTNIGTAVFTNLTQDHLDYHGTMEEYQRAKGLLFAQLGNTYDPQDRKYAILNADDEAHTYFRDITPAQVVTYGIDNHADIRAKNIQLTSQGITFTVEYYKGSETVRLQMLGKFNVYNALAAIAAALVEGISLTSIKHSLAQVKGVPGRLEVVDEGQPYTVLVDYAHTPDSLKNVLQTVQEFAIGKVFCVIGCGGDRDRTKRPLMAQIATAHADYAILTSDNPRSEEPQVILNDMKNGLAQTGTPQERYTCIVDRQTAIDTAIQQASPGDIVVIAGKGHETYQQLKDETIHFDDREVARQAIQNNKK